MKSKLILAAALLFALASLNPAAAPLAAQDAPSKEKISAKKYDSLKKSLAAEPWYTRALGAIAGRSFEDSKVALTLLSRWQEEKDIKVKLFLLESLATWPTESLQAFVDEDMMDEVVKIVSTAKDQLTLDACHAFLTAVFGSDPGKESRRCVAAWKGARGKWKKIHEDAVEAWEGANGPLAEHRDDGSFDGGARYIGSAKLNDYLDEYQSVNLDVGFIIDDTTRMSSISDSLRNGLQRVIPAWKLIAPKLKVGILTYNTGGVSVRNKPTGDQEAMMRAVKILSFGSSAEELFAPIDKVITEFLGKYEWSKQGAKHMVVIGATPAMQPHQDAVVGKVKAAVSAGFVGHFFGINQGSNVAPKNIDGFDTYARNGGGVEVVITAETDLQKELFEVIFGNGSFEYSDEFADGLVRYTTELR